MKKSNSIRRGPLDRRRLDKEPEPLSSIDDFEEVALNPVAEHETAPLKKTLTASSEHITRQISSKRNSNPVTNLLQREKLYSMSMENLKTSAVTSGPTARQLSSSSLPFPERDEAGPAGRHSPLELDEALARSSSEHSEIEMPSTPTRSEVPAIAESPRKSKDEQQVLSFPSPKDSRSERKATAKALVRDMRPMIDQRVESLPISREKEALLACTRPTYLPPKPRKEEKKHLREFEKLMFGSLEAEKRLQKRRSKALMQKTKHLANSADTWTNHILPHFNTAVKDPRTKVLWWNGLPNRVRGEIWSTCVGNTLSVTAETFKLALSKSEATEKQLRTRAEDDEDRNEFLLTLESYELLELSVARTFPELRIFQAGGPLHSSLVQVLKAYLYYRQDVMVAYVEGVNYIAGLLLLYQSVNQTFITLVNLLNRSLPLALYTRDEPVLNRFVALYLSKIATCLPRLHKHLHEELHLPPLMYLEPMLLSLFAKQAPPDVAARIFDIYAFEGDGFMIRAIIAIFKSLEHAMYGSAEEILTVLCGEDKEHTWQKNLQEDDFVKKCKYAF